MKKYLSLVPLIISISYAHLGEDVEEHQLPEILASDPILLGWSALMAVGLALVATFLVMQRRESKKK